MTYTLNSGLVATDTDMLLAAEEMERTGGAFAEAIALAWFRADSGNRQRLIDAFSDLFERWIKVVRAESNWS